MSDQPSWSMNAQLAMQASPQYFVWWYSVKSMLLVGAVAGLAYYAGLERGRRRR